MPVLKLLNETTSVAPEASMADISSELARAGAERIATEYRDGQPHGLSWSMKIAGTETWFTMPARVDNVFKILARRYRGYLSEPQKKGLYEKARRIAWRHLYRWTQVQVALVATGLMEPAEPFLPFAVVPGSGQTLFQAFVEARALPQGKSQ